MLVLGLHAGAEVRLRATGTDGEDTYTSSAATFHTDALPGDWPDCLGTFTADESEFDTQEAVCTTGFLWDGAPLYFCVDRFGEIVHSLQHPDGHSFAMARVLRSGDWAAVGESQSVLLVFDRRGELVRQWTPEFFQDQTRFDHEAIDMHDVIELTEGPWDGALALITTCSDTIEGQTLVGNGVLVFDAATEQVLWDWCAHGTVGDGEPIDPLLAYDREVFEDGEEQAWLHVNGLLHGLDPDGGQFFWLSSRTQNWLFKVDVDTDQVVWRLGYEGDFQLVEDLSDPTSPALPQAEWFYHQHSPEWLERDGSRTRFLLHDNGNVRAAEDGALSSEPLYSRVAEFTLDEDTLRASLSYEFGDPDPASPGHFYAARHGDADMLPGGDAVVLTMGHEPTLIGEASYPEAQERWRLSCDMENPDKAMYRVDFFPSLYETTWGYE